MPAAVPLHRNACAFLATRSRVFLKKDMQSNSGAVQKMVILKSPPGRRARARDQDLEEEGDENGFLGEQNYIQALGADNMEGE